MKQQNRKEQYREMLKNELKQIEQALLLYPPKGDDERFKKLTERAVLLRETLKKLEES